MNILLLSYMTEGISPAWDGDIPAVPHALGTHDTATSSHHCSPHNPRRPAALSPKKAGTRPGEQIIFASPGHSPAVFVPGWILGEAREGSEQQRQRWGRHRADPAYLFEVTPGRGSWSSDPGCHPGTGPIHLPARPPC